MISKATTPQLSPQQQEFIHRAAWKGAVLGALNVLVRVTAIRGIVMIAVIGGIVLALTALSAPDPWRLGVLSIYSLFVVVPVVWLSSRQ